MINKYLLICSLLILSLDSFGQAQNELRIYYGASSSEFLRNEILIGSGSSEIKDQSEFGIKYLKHLNENIALETGVNYHNSTISIKPAFTGETREVRDENFELISVPIMVNYTFWKYFFVNGGALIDFQITQNSTNSQDGIGYAFGIGGQYDIQDFTIFINPNFKKHSLIPFEKSNNHQKLTELGIQIGLGYKF